VEAVRGMLGVLQHGVPPGSDVFFLQPGGQEALKPVTGAFEPFATFMEISCSRWLTAVSRATEILLVRVEFCLRSLDCGGQFMCLGAVKVDALLFLGEALD
jgi:hypothetical protein